VSVCNIRTAVGNGIPGSTGDGGPASAATLNIPSGLTTDATSLYAAESTGARLRRLSLVTGTVTTYLGTGSPTGTFLGVNATAANVGVLSFVVVLPNRDVAVGSTTRCTVVAVDGVSQLTYALAGNSTCLGSGVPAESDVGANGTAFAVPRGGAVWNDGLFVSTSNDHRVRLVNLTTGALVLRHGCSGWSHHTCVVRLMALLPPPPPPRTVATWANAAGTAGNSGNDGDAVAAQLSGPEGLLVYNDLLLIANSGANVIRAVSLVTRVITTWSGTGVAATAGINGHRSSATLNVPWGLALIPTDNSVLITLATGCRVLRVTSVGVVRQFSGTGGCGTAGDGAAATAANINQPLAVAVDNSTASADGMVTVYISEAAAHRVRRGQHCRPPPLSFQPSPPSLASLWCRCARCGGVRPRVMQRCRPSQ